MRVLGWFFRFDYLFLAETCAISLYLYLSFSCSSISLTIYHCTYILICVSVYECRGDAWTWIMICFLFVCSPLPPPYSLQGDYAELMMPPTPPPRRVQPQSLSPPPPPPSAAGPAVATTLPHAPSFSRIASGLKLAQAQAMAVAGFLPEPPYDWRAAPVAPLHTFLVDTAAGDVRHAR